jgi:hypothetical protein
VLWAKILSILEEQPPASHPRTIKFSHPNGEDNEEYYLKIHYGSGFLRRFKDRFRDSKAFRALRESEALAANGFGAPLIVAAGEERRCGFLSKAFVLSMEIKGAILPFFLRDAFPGPLDSAAVRKKRDCLRRLAIEIRRLHQSGFVHGDLTPNNVFVRWEGGEPVFLFMDNDRTRRYPAWLPQRLWRRNLVQLNRFVLPGITLQDRLRFLGVYLNEKRPARGDRQLIEWLVKKTRERCRERNVLAAEVSFREMLRWNGPLAKK